MNKLLLVALWLSTQNPASLCGGMSLYSHPIPEKMLEIGTHPVAETGYSSLWVETGTSSLPLQKKHKNRGELKQARVVTSEHVGVREIRLRFALDPEDPDCTFDLISASGVFSTGHLNEVAVDPNQPEEIRYEFVEDRWTSVQLRPLDDRVRNLAEKWVKLLVAEYCQDQGLECKK